MSLKQVPCPRCGQPAEYGASNPFRPFCSERCKIIDLGKWASGDYRVPLDETELDGKLDLPDSDDEDQDDTSES